MLLAPVKEGSTGHVTRIKISLWTDIAPKNNY